MQEKAHQAADFAAEKAPVVKDKVAETAGVAAAKVKAVDRLHRRPQPGRLKLGEDTGPQGTSLTAAEGQ